MGHFKTAGCLRLGVGVGGGENLKALWEASCQQIKRRLEMISAPFVDVWSHGICKITKNTPLTLFDFLPLEKALGFAWLFSVSGVTCHGKPAQGSYTFRTGKSSGNQSSQGAGGG